MKSNLQHFKKHTACPLLSLPGIIAVPVAQDVKCNLKVQIHFPTRVQPTQLNPELLWGSVNAVEVAEFWPTVSVNLQRITADAPGCSAQLGSYSSWSKQTCFQILPCWVGHQRKQECRQRILSIRRWPMPWVVSIPVLLLQILQLRKVWGTGWEASNYQQHSTMPQVH